MKRRKQHEYEPARLGWPNPNKPMKDDISKSNKCIDLTNGEGSNTIYPKLYSQNAKFIKTTNTIQHRKRSSTVSKSSSSFTTRNCSDTILLIEKYKPKHSKDLCISTRKVKEVREWIHNSYIDGNSKLLILIGDPGIGKSTMVQILAKEMNISILQWNNDESILIDDNLHYNNKSSVVKSFEEFLSSSIHGYCELDIQYDDSSNSSLDKENKYLNDNMIRSLILIDDLPYVHTAQAQDAFRIMFTNYIQNTKVPIILIYSNVSEGKPAFGEIEKLIDTSILKSTVIKCAQISDKIIKKVLSAILTKEEQRSRYSSQHKNDNNSFLDEICISSHGDIRNAINALQLHIVAMKEKRKLSFGSSSRKKKALANSSSIYERDCRLNSFHALGKLLYAKRVSINENIDNGSPSFHTLEKLLYDNTDATIPSSQYNTTTPTSTQECCTTRRPPLSFDPEKVIQENDMTDIHTSLCFLTYNCPDFFTDIIDLSNAYSSFSDAALFASRCFHSQRDHGDTIFPNEYLASITSRTVAEYNKNPSPNRFRSFQKPPIFSVNKKQMGNKIKIRQLCRRLSIGSTTHLPLDCSIASSDMVVLDYMPFMRSIIPSETQFAIENLYSHVKNEEDGDEVLPQDEVESLLHLELQEQNQILQEDDIVED